MKFVIPLLLTILCLHVSSVSFANASAGLMPIDDIIELESKPGQKYQLSPPIETLNPKFRNPVRDGAQLSEQDEKNLNLLWNTILSKNAIIQFGLKQLATPPELRYAHQSTMSKAISGLLSGAAMLPLAMGADQYTAGASVIGANLTEKAIRESKKVDPSTLPSDTELVELSGLVQTLQEDLVKNYFEYKNHLNTLAQLSQLSQYIQGQLQSAPSAEKYLWSRQQYELCRQQELATKHAAKQNYLLLERLAGAQTLRQVVFESPHLSVKSTSATMENAPIAEPSESNKL